MQIHHQGYCRKNRKIRSKWSRDLLF